MKRLALLLTISALASASLVRLPEAGDAVGTVDVDAELQRVFAPGGSSTKGSNAGTQGEGDNDKDAGIGADGAGLNLADILTVERRASLWWDYARDVASVVS
jgi:hypothetical protein